MSERTYQQKLVWERLNENFKTILVLNEKLDSRAALLTTSSAAVVGIITAAKFLPPAARQPLDTESVLLGLVCCCTVAMFWYGAKVWIPNWKGLPGPTDPKILFEQYIALEENVAFNNALIDLGASTETAIASNSQKANAVTTMVRVLQLQLLLLAVAIGWSGIVGLWNTL